MSKNIKEIIDSHFQSFISANNKIYRAGIDFGRQSETYSIPIESNKNKNVYKAQGSIDYISPDGTELPVKDGEILDSDIKIVAVRRCFK